MIKQLEIKNFQSHEDTTLEFSKGLNVIVGDSQAGKSQIEKAISYLCFHKPETKSPYPNNRQAKEIFIQGVFDNGLLSLSKKISKKNKVISSKYLLNGQSFKEFGRNPPQEVIDFVNLTDLNFQWAWESNFLVLETPGNIGKRINEFIDLDSVDRWLKKLNSDISKNKREENNLLADIEQIKSNLEKYNELDKLGEWIKKIERGENEKQILFKKIRNIESLRIEYEKFDRQAGLIEKTLKKIKAIYDKIVINEDAKKEIKQKIELLRQYLRLNRKENELKEKTGQVQKEYDEMLDGYICPIFDIECEKGEEK